MAGDLPQHARDGLPGQTTAISARDSVTGLDIPNVGDDANNAIRVNVVAGGGGGGGDVNLTGINGEPPDVGPGNWGLGTLRVILPDDQPFVPVGNVQPGSSKDDAGVLDGDPIIARKIGILPILNNNASGLTRALSGVFDGDARVAADDMGLIPMGVVDDGTVAVPAVGDYTPLRLSPSGAGVLIAAVPSGPGGVLLPIRGSDPGGNGTATLYVQPDIDAPPFPVQVAAATGSVSNAPAAKTTDDHFAATGDGANQQLTLGGQLASPKHFSIQVIADGGVVPTAWDVRVEVSLDGGATYGSVLTHTNADGNGAVKGLATPTPGSSYRARCAGLTLGLSAGLTAYVCAST